MKFFKETKSVNAGFIFILIVIIGIGVASYREINEVFEAAEWRKHTYRVLNHLEEILSQVALAEEGQRAYLITDDNSYLEPYYASKKTIKSNLSELDVLLNDNPSQKRRLDSLRTLISSRFSILQRKINLQKKGDVAGAIDYIKRGVGKKFMVQIRSLVAEMQNEDYRLLQMRDDAVVVTVRSTFVTIIVGTSVSIIIFLAVFYILSREIFERKKTEKELISEKEFSERLLNSSVDGIVAFDKNYRYTLWNPGMEALTGIEKSETLGKSIYDVFPLLKKIGEDKNLERTLSGNYVIVKDRFFIIKKTGRKGYVEAYYSPIYNLSKEVIGGLVILRDTTQRKLALEESERAKKNLEKRVNERTAELSKINNELKKEIAERKKVQDQVNIQLEEKVVLLREIHHRVKNNLQVISSLLNLQSGYIEDEKSKEIFIESQNRIRSMALIHEKLYQSKDFRKIKFSDYINSLIKDLFRTYNIDPDRIKLKTDIKDIYFEIDTAILCGLIINELISNSFKHAFPNGGNGEVYISLTQTKNYTYTLLVRDNGIGLPPDIDIHETETLGLQLISTLTEQLEGDIELNGNGCTEIKITFEE